MRIYGLRERQLAAHQPAGSLHLLQLFLQLSIPFLLLQQLPLHCAQLLLCLALDVIGHHHSRLQVSLETAPLFRVILCKEKNQGMGNLTGKLGQFQKEPRFGFAADGRVGKGGTAIHTFLNRALNARSSIREVLICMLCLFHISVAHVISHWLLAMIAIKF